MKEIDDAEMLEIDGGSATTVVIASMIVSAVVSFVVGVLHGYVNPIECNK